MPSKRTRARNERRGAAVVEFAVVAPVLFLLIFGLIEFSRMVMIKEVMADAAQLGCRKAALATTTSTSQVEAEIQGYLASVILNPSGSDAVNVAVSPSGLSGLNSGTPISVTVDVDFSAVSWLPGNLLGLSGTEKLSATATLQRE